MVDCSTEHACEVSPFHLNVAFQFLLFLVLCFVVVGVGFHLVLWYEGVTVDVALPLSGRLDMTAAASSKAAMGKKKGKNGRLFH